jgi:hypothetical protein
MSPLFRRIIGALAAICVLSGAGLATRHLDARADAAAREKARVEADLALDSARKALDAALRTVEARAVAGANLNPVRALVVARVDSATLLDAFGTEPWWAPFREEFTVHTLVTGTRRFDFSPDGRARPAELSSLLQAASDKALASGLLLAGGEPHLAAVAAVDVPRGAARLVLARPLRDSDLGASPGTAPRAWVLLDEGGRSLLRAGSAAGAPPGEAPAQGDMGRVDARGDWAVSRAQVAPGLFLQAHVDTREQATLARAAGRGLLLPLWLTAGLVALVALALGLRRPRSSEMKQRLDETHARLAAAEAELSRITRTMGAVTGGTGPQPRPRTEPSLEAPVPFGRYELLKCIGQGGMARVFLALARGTGGFERLFVIKRLHEPLARQPEAVAHFIDEARLGASLVHSNVVPVYDFGQVDGEYYMASEYILGRDLDALVRRSLAVDGVALPASTVLFIAHEALRALAYAHGRRDAQGRPMSLVHRDVSANNILVSGQGEVKLLDFGIAKSADRTAQQTQAGLVKGNVNFMAPEQARGLDVDARADLFSLGLTLYWCLTGEYLYDGRTDYDRLVQAARGPGPAEWERVDRLPEPLVSLLRRALQPDPAARFQSAEEFAAALPPLGPEGGTLLAHALLRLFDAELRAETAYRSRLFVPAVPLDQAHTG